MQPEVRALKIVSQLKLLAKGDPEAWENTFEDTDPKPHSQLNRKCSCEAKEKPALPWRGRSDKTDGEGGAW